MRRCAGFLRAMRIAPFIMLLGSAIATASTIEYTDQARFASAAGSLRIVNFDDVSGVLEPGFSFSSGLTVMSRSGVPVNVISVPVGWAGIWNANSQPNVVSVSITPTGGFSDVSDDIDFIFAQPVRAAGLWIGNVGPGKTEVQFLDASGNIVARETFSEASPGLLGAAGDGNNRIFYGAISDSQIARIRTVDLAGDSDGVTYDDVLFSSNVRSRRQTQEYFSQQRFQSAAGGATQLRAVTFEGLSSTTTTLHGGEYEIAGLRITNRSGAPIHLVDVSGPGSGFVTPTNANSPTRVISSSINADRAYFNVADDFDFELRGPARAVGLWIGNIGPGETTVQVLGAGDRIIASEVFTPRHPGMVGGRDGDNRIFYGVVSEWPIERIRTVEPPDDSDGVTYDDIQYSVTAMVPARLRVLQMNIWEWPAGGGESVAERQKRLLEFVRQEHPDLITFQEAVNHGGIGDALRELGYDTFAQPPEPPAYPVTGLSASRWPLVGSFIQDLRLVGDPDDGFPYAALHSTVNLPAPLPALGFVNYKPAWRPEYGLQRLAQAEQLVPRIEHTFGRSNPVIIGGDFDDVDWSDGVRFILNRGDFGDTWAEWQPNEPLEAVTFSCSRNPMAALVTEICGNDPRNQAFLPWIRERRIDYVMGRPAENGCGLSNLHWDHSSIQPLLDPVLGPVSGHFAVVADLVLTTADCAP